MSVENNILKRTRCGNSCSYSNITIFCLDCPGLMCNSCNLDMHRNLKHCVLEFQNLVMQWNDKELITQLFDDKILGANVFKEVTRELKVSSPSVTRPEVAQGVPGSWICDECTFENRAEVVKCDICKFFRKVHDFSRDYKKRLEKYVETVNPLIKKLDSEMGVPVEHAVMIYLDTVTTKVDILAWYKQQYLADKDSSTVTEIVAQYGHDLSLNSLADKYYQSLTIKNDLFLENVPTGMVKDGMSQTGRLLTVEDFNRDIALPNEMRDREISEDELWAVVRKTDNFTDRQKRMLMTELDLPGSDKVDFLHAIMNHSELGPYLRESCPNGNVKMEHLRQAVLDQIEFIEVITFLKKECPLCINDFPMPQMQLLLICNHEFCKACFKQWLESNITERYPCKWGCPFCPEDMFERVDKTLHYFNLRDFIRDNNCDEAVVKMFDDKLLYERLMGSKNFHWCANDQCVNGFEAEGRNMKVQCPSCSIHMCVQCNREWKPQHENATCQQYEMWILKNDPNLAKVLNDIGIECPNCQMRYALAPGGCLHFECRACGWVFCGGCYVEFTSRCAVANCTMGTAFHGHHPRNCLYFLRDYEVNVLENLLQKADYPKLKDKPDKICPFKVTDEHTMKNKDCGTPVCGSTGLCAQHYKEYLVQFVNRLKIDPASLATSEALNLMLVQSLRKKLEKVAGETEDAFVVRLRTEVQKNCPMYIPKGLDVVDGDA